jgi:peptide/nickel transport system permease protein
MLPPAWAGGSTTHWLGTDFFGHDILSQLIVGGRATLIVAVGALIIGGGTGTLLGLAAAYYGGWLDAVIMRIADFTYAFPVILVALLAAVVFGPSFPLVVAIIGLLIWARFARVVRSEVLSLRERDFVVLAQVAGASSTRILFRHLAPNVVNTLIVMATIQVSQAVLAEAGLSFLGVGVPPPNPSWGAMVNSGRSYLVEGWWIAAVPGLTILCVVIALSMVGDWLRDALDPESQSR